MTPAFLLDARKSAALLGMSLRLFRDMSKEPGFPAARPLGPRNTRWVRTELEAWAVALPASRKPEPEHLAVARKAKASKRPTAARPLPASRPHAYAPPEGAA